MLTAELRINGRLIGHAYLVNVTAAMPSHDDPGAPDDYTWEVYTVASGTECGTLSHRREGGAWRLLRDALTAYLKRA